MTKSGKLWFNTIYHRDSGEDHQPFIKICNKQDLIPSIVEIVVKISPTLHQNLQRTSFDTICHIPIVCLASCNHAPLEGVQHHECFSLGCLETPRILHPDYASSPRAYPYSILGYRTSHTPTLVQLLYT
jgi:hypothetical protein